MATFLHKLEYFQGILFLTTNQPSGLDAAIRNRVHVSLTYSDLGHDARKEVFQQFLRKDSGLAVHVDDQELAALAQVTLKTRIEAPAVSINGRQVSGTHD